MFQQYYGFSLQCCSTLSSPRGLGLETGLESSNSLYQMVIDIDFRSSDIPPLPNNGIFKSVCWTFADPLNRL